MELEAWKGDWGLPSVDVECLKVMAYTKFLGSSIKFQEKRSPFFTLNGKLPVFRDGKQEFYNFEDITAYLKLQGINADAHLSSVQLADSLAFSRHVEQQLRPCLQHTWWLDSNNFQQVVRPWYARTLPFPLNYYYPRRFQQQAQEMMDALYGEDCEEQMVHYAIRQTAEKCFADLSLRLGDSDFFLGAGPSSLDAVVFAHLALILRAPLTACALQKNLQTYDNLVKFVNRICQRFFSALHQDYIARNAKKKLTEDPEKRLLSNQTRNKLFAGLFAVLAMTGYAVSNSLLQINFKEEFHNSYEYNDMFEIENDDE